MSTSTNVANIPIWQNLSLENLPNEVWKPVKGYEGLYDISNLGRLKSKFGRCMFRRDKILRQHKNKGGYLSSQLYCNKIKKRIMIHLLVTYSFLNHKTKEGYVVDHINNIKDDNSLENLQIITARYNNIKDRKKSKTGFVGISKTKHNKYKSVIYYKGVEYFLGNHKKINRAKLAYSKALELIKKNPNNLKDKLKKLAIELRLS